MTIKHYDALYQEIKVGSLVLRSTGGSAGFDAPGIVERLTPKKIKIGKTSAVNPSNVIVIDNLIRNLSEEVLLDYLLTNEDWCAGRANIISVLNNPSEEVLRAAVSLNKDVLKYINDDTMKAYINLTT